MGRKRTNPRNYTAMTRLDQNRAVGQLANRAGAMPGDVRNIAIWGNHSPTMFPNYYEATIGGKAVTEVITDEAAVERCPDRAELAGADPREHLLDAVEHQARDTIARHDASRRQLRGDAIGALVEFPVGERSALDSAERRDAVSARLLAHQRRHVEPFCGTPLHHDHARPRWSGAHGCVTGLSCLSCWRLYPVDDIRQRSRPNCPSAHHGGDPCTLDC